MSVVRLPKPATFRNWLAFTLILGTSAVFAQTGTPAPAPTTQTPASSPADHAKPPEATPPGDVSAGEIREIEARPVLRLRGQSTWESGFATLKKAIVDLGAEAARLNLVRSATTRHPGHAMVHFVDSDDLGFTFEAMLPLAAPAPAGTAFGAGFDATQSPAGRAVVFPFEGAYDDIDTAYEAATAWLDDKNLVSTGKFLEEYELVPDKSDETTMKLKIIVFLK